MATSAEIDEASLGTWTCKMPSSRAFLCCSTMLICRSLSNTKWFVTPVGRRSSQRSPRNRCCWSGVLFLVPRVLSGSPVRSSVYSWPCIHTTCVFCCWYSRRWIHSLVFPFSADKICCTSLHKNSPSHEDCCCLDQQRTMITNESTWFFHRAGIQQSCCLFMLFLRPAGERRNEAFFCFSRYAAWLLYLRTQMAPDGSGQKQGWNGSCVGILQSFSKKSPAT